MKVFCIFFFLGFSRVGSALTSLNLINLLSKPGTIEQLRGLKFSEAEGSLFKGNHTKFSFFNLDGKPTITGVRYNRGSDRRDHLKSQSGVKILFTVRPSKQVIDSINYRIKMSYFDSFSPKSLNVKHLDEDSNEELKIELSDQNSVVRYAQWLSVEKNKLLMMAYYDENGNLLYLDIANNAEDEKLSQGGKTQNFILEQFPKNMLLKENSGKVIDFNDVDADRKFCKELIAFIGDLGRGNHDTREHHSDHIGETGRHDGVDQ